MPGPVWACLSGCGDDFLAYPPMQLRGCHTELTSPFFCHDGRGSGSVPTFPRLPLSSGRKPWRKTSHGRTSQRPETPANRTRKFAKRPWTAWASGFRSRPSNVFHLHPGRRKACLANHREYQRDRNVRNTRTGLGFSCCTLVGSAGKPITGFTFVDLKPDSECEP